MSTPCFTGIGVALVTLFDADGALDADATAEHAARLVDLGVDAVVVAGSTGEAVALEPDERAALLAAVRRAVPAGRAVVLAGTGAPSARQAVALTRAAVDGGADGVLVLSPPRVVDPRAYYEAVAAVCGPATIFGYHFPAVSGPGIDVGALGDLPFEHLKDSTGQPDRLLAELTTWDGHVYPGSSAILSMSGPLGCPGAILALANAEPEDCRRAFAGDAEAQRRLAAPHLASSARFPAGIKELTAARFGTPTHARLA